MINVTFTAFAIWIILYMVRIWQIGGLSQERIENSELLKPQRDYLVEVIGQILPSPQSTLLSGILIGAQNSLPYHLKQDLQKTSTIHMVVVSGQNLTILAGFLSTLTYLLGRKKTIFLSLAVILLYSLLTGLQIPTIRALIMAFFAYGAQILGREKTGWWVLFLTAGIMLLYNPNYLINISFQLSFMATLAVIVVAPVIKKRLMRVPNILREDLAVSFSAQILTLPIIAYYFHQISVIGLLANLLVLWTIPIIMIFGFASLIVGVVNIFLAKIVALVPMVLLTYYLDVVQLLGRLSFSAVKVEDLSILFWAGYYVLIASLVLTLDMLSLNHDQKSAEK